MTAAILVLLVTADVGPAVDSIGMTVSDLDRSVAFYTQVLSFEKVSEIELEGQEIERLTGVFGSHIRVRQIAAWVRVHRADGIPGGAGPPRADRSTQ